VGAAWRDIESEKPVENGWLGRSAAMSKDCSTIVIGGGEDLNVPDYMAVYHF
jgi:hypothetical protein